MPRPDYSYQDYTEGPGGSPIGRDPYYAFDAGGSGMSVAFRSIGRDALYDALPADPQPWELPEPGPSLGTILAVGGLALVSSAVLLKWLGLLGGPRG